jgi:hypothetical protein
LFGAMTVYCAVSRSVDSFPGCLLVNATLLGWSARLRRSLVNFLRTDHVQGSTEILASCHGSKLQSQWPEESYSSVYISLSSCNREENTQCMRRLSTLLRASQIASRLLNRPPTAPLQHPTKTHFSTTPPHLRYQIPKRKEVAMPSDTTTHKGKPFERAPFEQLMKVRKTVSRNSHA